MVVTTRWLRCAAGLALVLALGCSSSGGDGGQPPAGFTQADLTGEWDMLTLSTNSSQGWSFVHFRLDAGGRIEILAYLDDDGATALPAVDARLTIGADGTVLQAGADATPSFHGTMTRTKALVFATDEEGSPAAVRRRLWVMRKRVPGVGYSSADIAGSAFAIHGIYSGPGYGWMHGSGTTDAAGVLSLAEIHDSRGGTSSPGQVATLTIDATGLVVNTGGVLRGVMSADKDSIFCVDVSGDHDPGLMVFQRTGRTFALADLAGDHAFHSVTSGADTAASGWTHGTSTISATGLLEFTSFLNSAGSTALPADRQLAVTATGVITQPTDDTFHGQLSWNADWYLRTGGPAASPLMALVAR